MNLAIKENELSLRFVPEYLHDAFEDIFLEWYIEFFEYYGHALPQPILISIDLMNRGFINEMDEILGFERELSWFIGTVLEEKRSDKENGDPEELTMLDMSVGEICRFELDLVVMLERFQMVYIDENTKIARNIPITEVW